MADAGSLGIASILQGSALTAMFQDPATDSRAPDLFAITQLGVIYAGPKATKLAEHGGFSDNDVDVPPVVSRQGMDGGPVDAPVTTQQIAPTILEALGLSGAKLDAVRMEGTRRLRSVGSTSARGMASE